MEWQGKGENRGTEKYGEKKGWRREGHGGQDIGRGRDVGRRMMGRKKMRVERNIGRERDGGGRAMEEKGTYEEGRTLRERDIGKGIFEKEVLKLKSI